MQIRLHFTVFLMFLVQLIFCQEFSYSKDYDKDYKKYYQEILIDIESKNDSNIYAICHGTIHNDGLFKNRVLIFRELDLEGNEINTSHFDINTPSEGTGGYLLESYDMEVVFTEEFIYVSTLVDRTYQDSTIYSNLRLYKLNYSGEEVNRKDWTRDHVVGLHAITYDESKDSIYLMAFYGYRNTNPDIELNAIDSEFNSEIQYRKLNIDDTSINDMYIQNDTIFLSGTYNDENNIYDAPELIWDGYINQDSIELNHQFYYYENLSLNKITRYDNNRTIYRAKNRRSYSNIFLYQDRKLRFNFLESGNKTVSDLLPIGNQFLLTIFDYSELNITENKITHLILDQKGYEIDRRDYSYPSMSYILDTINIGDYYYVISKMYTPQDEQHDQYIKIIRYQITS